MDAPRETELIHEWNVPEALPEWECKLNDETLRDGLQSPSVANPPIEDKVEILHYMEDLGMYSAAIGLPAAGAHSYNDCLALATEIAQNNMKIYPYCAARTVESDLVPIVDISQKTGLRVQAAMFLFSSPIRQFAEGWNIDRLLQVSEAAVEFAHRHDVPVMFVTEDTTRALPETLERLYSMVIDHGVERVCVADTVGHATPSGVRAVTGFIKNLIDRSGRKVGLDWHGHRDRGLGLYNSIAAYYAGADRIHGTALGIGERVGNAPIDLIMVNFKLAGVIDNDLTKLPAYVKKVSESCKVAIPDNYPVVGRDAFRTATGVHADAIVKAYQKGDSWLANRIYSGVPADMFGLEQVIEVGPMSGKSNVRFWLDRHGVEATDELVDNIFAHAKKAGHILSDDEIRGLIDDGGD
jgi:2-isopropylmalate synthase